MVSPGNCADGHFSVDERCVSCFCAGITKTCQATGRYRNQISLRFNEEDDYKGNEALMIMKFLFMELIYQSKYFSESFFKYLSYSHFEYKRITGQMNLFYLWPPGVNVTYPSRPGTPPLSSTQLLINTEMEEFQLVDLSRRFLNLDSFWTLPRQFLGNKVSETVQTFFLFLCHLTHRQKHA